MTDRRARLHDLVDRIPEERLKEAEFTIGPLTYPEADEPLTVEEQISILEARISHLKGESIPHEEIERRFGLER